MKFGEYVQSLRMAKNLSLSEAARELQISPQRLCDIEQGRRYFTRPPPLSVLKKIALVYDHPIAHLVTNTEFFQYEKSLIHDLLASLEPIAKNLENKALEMVIEAKQYTPEMESLATESHALTQDLRAAILVAKSRYLRVQRSEPSFPSLPPPPGKTG